MKKNYISPMISAQTIETVNILCASGDSLQGAIQLNRTGTAVSDAY